MAINHHTLYLANNKFMRKLDEEDMEGLVLTKTATILTIEPGLNIKTTRLEEKGKTTLILLLLLITDNVIISMILMMIMTLMKDMKNGDELGTIEEPLDQGKEETKTLMVLEE